jgi:hypothetical protein
VDRNHSKELVRELVFYLSFIIPAQAQARHLYEIAFAMDSMTNNYIARGGSAAVMKVDVQANWRVSIFHQKPFLCQHLMAASVHSSTFLLLR